MIKLRQNPADDACENCGVEGLQPFEIGPNHQMMYCENCLLYQKGSAPPEDFYQAPAYHAKYRSRRASKIVTAMIRLASTTKYLKQKSPKLLDIGCSIGATLAAAERLGWTASGVDVSRNSVEACRRIGLDCHTISDHQLPFDDNTFDVVSNWHVIEHVEDVHQTLAEWKRVMKPGGVMILETPDSQCWKARRLGARYKRFWPKEHLYTFTQGNMASILETAGFEILPTRVIGDPKALPLAITGYAMAYRNWRKLGRKFKWCKSIEICCRKPVNSSQPVQIPARMAA